MARFGGDRQFHRPVEGLQLRALALQLPGAGDGWDGWDGWFNDDHSDPYRTYIGLIESKRTKEKKPCQLSQRFGVFCRGRSQAPFR